MLTLVVENGYLGILEYIVLRALGEVVEVVIIRRVVVALKERIAFILDPIHGLLRPVRAVPWRWGEVYTIWVWTTATSDTWLRDLLVRIGVGDFAAVPIEEDLLAARIGSVDPVERANASTLGARRKVGGDLEVREAIPHASLVR